MPNGLSEAPWPQRREAPVHRAKPRVADLSAKHLQLVAEHRDLNILGAVIRRACDKASHPRAIKERRNSIRACYGSASWKTNRSFRALQHLGDRGLPRAREPREPDGEPPPLPRHRKLLPTAPSGVSMSNIFMMVGPTSMRLSPSTSPTG